MTTAVQPERILRDLRELWDQLGRDQETAGGVLRACAMTLLVVADDEADAEHARQTLGVLMHDHPSRAIVVRIRNDGEVEARVFAECWKPFGSNQQICAEGIEVTAGTRQMADVARLLVPLLVPDLPVVLWCRGARAFSSGELEPLFSLAEKIVFDSAGVSHANAALAVLREARGRGRRVADLAWTRLTGWRETLANVFDEGILAAAAVRSVQVTSGGAGPSTSVLYFVRWLERMLPSAKVTQEPVPGEPGLRSVTLSGAGAEIAITMVDSASVEVRAGARTSRSLLPPVSDDALMREELAILGGDPVFDRVLA